MIVIEAFSQLIGRLLHAIANRDHSGALPCLPLLAADSLAYRVHDVEIPYLSSICRNTREDEPPDFLIIDGESLI